MYSCLHYNARFRRIGGGSRLWEWVCKACGAITVRVRHAPKGVRIVWSAVVVDRREAA